MASPLSLPLVASWALVLLSTAVLSYFVLFRLTLRLLGAHLLRRSAANRQSVIDHVSKLSLASSSAAASTSAAEASRARIVGFFHPYCNAGGGGERVLWGAIRAVQESYPAVMCAVYTGDHVEKDEILSRVESRFSIKLDPERVLFRYLTTRRMVAASTWKHFTLLGQSLGSLVLAWDAFTLLVPDVFVDTMGYAFTLPLAKLLFDIPTAAYVHYPTISTDMLAALPASASLRTQLKRKYWHFFAALYARTGKYVDVVMANGSWTAAHIRSLWRRDDVAVVFPPCAVAGLIERIPLSLNGAGMEREKILLCIAQFRPEKRHELIIKAFARFLEKTRKHKDARLVLVGSVRHSEDAKDVYMLRLLARERGVNESVEFVTDAPWPDVQDLLARVSVGVNAMWNEHFGIGVVEYQAAGLISVVHDSGGPKLDIVVPVDGGPTGYHADTESEFAAAFETALGLDPHAAAQMRLRARTSSLRFSDQVFERAWLAEFAKLKV